MSKAQQWLLDLLTDGKPHSSDEIRTLSSLSLGKEITVHPRITDLREMGYIIPSTRKNGLHYFQLKGKEDPPVKESSPVKGYTYNNMADGDDPKNGNVCQIIGRAASDTEQLTYGPMFQVKFGDGEILTVFAAELNPYYAV